MEPPLGRKLNDVFAYAKKDLAAGDTVHHALGGDEVYGMVDSVAHAEAGRGLGIALLEAIEGKHAVLKTAKTRDEALTVDDVELPDTPYHRLLARQEALIG